MNNPLPSPRSPVAGGREPAPARHDPASGKSPPFQLNVRFYRVMKPRRVYPLVVELPRASAKPVAGQAPLVVRPVVTGAVVAPAEQALDLNAVGGRLTFQVTPLAKGRMGDSRVELVQQGRAVERIPLKMRTKTQRLTWLLLLLTLIVPSVLVYYTDRDMGRLTGEVPAHGPERQALERKIPGGAPGPQVEAPLAPEGKSISIKPRPGEPGEILQYRISHVVHRNCPKPDRETFGDYFGWLGDFCERIIKAQPNYIVKKEPSSEDDAVEWVAYGIGYSYQFLCTAADNLYPAFFCAIALGTLTLLSMLSHRTIRGRTRKSGIRLPDGTSMGHVRSASAREEPATVVEAAD